MEISIDSEFAWGMSEERVEVATALRRLSRAKDMSPVDKLLICDAAARGSKCNNVQRAVCEVSCLFIYLLIFCFFICALLTSCSAFLQVVRNLSEQYSMDVAQLALLEVPSNGIDPVMCTSAHSFGRYLFSM